MDTDQKSCGAVVYRYHNEKLEILFIRTKRGNWSFPKGRMDPLETEVMTAIREIKEETGYSVSLEIGFRNEVPTIPVNKPGFCNSRSIVFFLANVRGGTFHPQLSEIREQAWVPATRESGSLINFLPDRQVYFNALDYLSLKYNTIETK